MPMVVLIAQESSNSVRLVSIMVLKFEGYDQKVVTGAISKYPMERCAL